MGKETHTQVRYRGEKKEPTTLHADEGSCLHFKSMLALEQINTRDTNIRLNKYEYERNNDKADDETSLTG